MDHACAVAIADAPTPRQQRLDGVWSVDVLVTVDGVPTPELPVRQGGRLPIRTTGDDGRVIVPVDLAVEGGLWLMSAHPEARAEGIELSRAELPTDVEIELTRFVDVDNVDYAFRDPGEPKRNGTAAQCAHCHLRINEGWFDSAHRSSASARYPSAPLTTSRSGSWGR